MKKFDVVIIGAGPAGVSCAINCLDQKLSVCIIDKAFFPREKLCAGILTHKSEKALIKNGFSTSYKNISTNSVDLILDDLTVSLKAKLCLKFVNRSTFDNDLLLQCQFKGAHLLLGLSVKEFNIEKNTLILTNYEYIGYDFLIIADGVNSKSRNMLNQPKLKRYLCIQTFISHHNIKPQLNIYNRLSLKFVKGFIGYQWFVPNEAGIILGTALYKENIPFSSLAEIHKYTCSMLVKEGNIAIKGGYVSTGEIIDFNHQLPNNVVFVGESSGLICPITGEGIYYALLSGQIAAQSINNSLTMSCSLVSNYTSLIKEHISRIHIDKAVLNKLYAVLVSNYGLAQLKDETQYLASLIDDTISTNYSTFNDKYVEICYLLR